MTASETTRRTPPTWAVAAIAGLFGLLFAYAVWTAVNYLVATVQAAGAAGLSLTTMGWVVWVLAIVLPILLFAVALALGLRRGLLSLALFLLTALTLVAAFWLDVVAYTTTVQIIG
ncbi:hypothetical protein [Microbacterium rhizophilus]|uniref:hypothetical protein n=1 Tax=Microbacterium rhizophilus TaxID=3138934 RepID=UPI0031E95A1B